MSKTKNKPGIHLHCSIRIGDDKHFYKMYQWYTVAPNGHISGRSWRWYKSKGSAVNNIKTTAKIFFPFFMGDESFAKYYDHSKPGSPLKSYL